MNNIQRKTLPVSEYKQRKRLLTVKEASQLLNVHSNTLRRWSDKGIIKCYRIGISAQRRFKVEDVEALLMQ